MRCVIVGGFPIETPSLSYVDETGYIGAHSSYSFSGNFGTAPKGLNKRRAWVLLRYTSVSGVSPNVTSQTIGGVSATIHWQPRVTAVTTLVHDFVLMSAEVNSGTSLTVSFNTGATLSNAVMFKTINLGSTLHSTDTGASTTTAALSLSTPAGGAIVALGMCGYSPPDVPSAASCDNLTTLADTTNNLFSGKIFVSAQSSLGCTYRPLPASATRSEAIGFGIKAT